MTQHPDSRPHRHPRWIGVRLGALALAVAPALAAPQATPEAEAAPRPAAQILADYERVVMPSMSNGNTAQAREEFRRTIRAASARKAALARELYAGHPDHPRLAGLLASRWALMTNALDHPAMVLEETGIVVEDQDSDALHRAAHLAAAWAAIHADGLTTARRRALVERGIEANPDSDLCAKYLMEFALTFIANPAEIGEVLARVEREWPDDRWARHPVTTARRALKQINQPITSEFRLGEDGAAVPLGGIDGIDFTVIQMCRSTFKSQADLVAELEAWKAKNPRVRVLTVMFYGSRGSAPCATRVREDAIEWPVHFTRSEFKREPGTWDTLAGPKLLLLDAGGRLVGFSERVDTLQERAAMLGGKAKADPPKARVEARLFQRNF